MTNKRWVAKPWEGYCGHYPTEEIKALLRRLGFTNIREAHNNGWRNQPKYVTFTASSMLYGDAMYNKVSKALDEHKVGIYEKAW